MLFPTHLAAAWLLGRRLHLPVVATLAGAALPDAVDKPLAAAGVTDLYHSVAHSGLVFGALAVVGGVAWVAGHADRRALAVGVGWGSHLALDAAGLVANGFAGNALFLLWPLAGPTDPRGLAPVAFAVQYVGTPGFYAELVVWALVTAALIRGRSTTPTDEPAHSR